MHLSRPGTTFQRDSRFARQTGASQSTTETDNTPSKRRTSNAGRARVCVRSKRRATCESLRHSTAAGSRCSKQRKVRARWRSREDWPMDSARLPTSRRCRRERGSKADRAVRWLRPSPPPNDIGAALPSVENARSSVAAFERRRSDIAKEQRGSFRAPPFKQWRREGRAAAFERRLPRPRRETRLTF